MLERIKFVNHLNESMDFGSKGIFVNSNDLHDYSWDYTKENDKISFFSKGVQKKKVPVIIACSSEAEGLALKNRLLEVCEKDVLANKHGKLVIGDYYLKCFVTGSKKDNYLIHKGYMKATLTVVTDYPQWVRETTTTFPVVDLNAVTSEKRNMDFNEDFPLDYASELKGRTLNNTGFVPTDFRMTIWGAVSEPVIFIAGHRYQINYTIEAGEYLIIDSRQKTIVLTKRNGEQVNLFNYRDRDSYIFEQIPAGSNSVNWNGLFGFDVTLIEERSEPKWT